MVTGGENRKEFVYAGSYLILEQGQAMFGITVGGDYAVTVTSDIPRNFRLKNLE